MIWSILHNACQTNRWSQSKRNRVRKRMRKRKRKRKSKRKRKRERVRGYATLWLQQQILEHGWLHALFMPFGGIVLLMGRL